MTCSKATVVLDAQIAAQNVSFLSTNSFQTNHLHGSIPSPMAGSALSLITNRAKKNQNFLVLKQKRSPFRTAVDLKYLQFFSETDSGRYDYTSMLSGFTHIDFT